GSPLRGEGSAPREDYNQAGNIGCDGVGGGKVESTTESDREVGMEVKVKGKEGGFAKPDDGDVDDFYKEVLLFHLLAWNKEKRKEKYLERGFEMLRSYI